MVKENRLKNEEIKNNIETKIDNLKISTDTAEYKNAIENINTEKEEIKETLTENNNKNNNFVKLVKNNRIYIIVTLVVLLIFILSDSKTKKGEKNNGRK